MAITFPLLRMLGGSVLLQTGSNILGPPETQIRQDVNRQFTNELPPPEAIFHAFNLGRYDRERAQALLAAANIDWDLSGLGRKLNFHQSSWEGIRAAMLPVPGIEAAMTGWAHGLLTATQRDAVIRRAGSRADIWQWTRDLALAAPSAELAASAFAREAITPTEYNDILIRAGGRPSLWGDAIQAYYSTPSVGEALSLRNRDIIDDAELDILLRRNSLGRERDRELIRRLRFAIPSISDLITMQVREAFDPALANQLGLYDESPRAIVPYFRAQGLDWDTGIIGNVDGADRMLTWPDMYWAMHWRPFSPEQVFRMYHLLRPERIKRYTDRGLRVQPFTLDDVRRWLRVQDYPPKVRDTLAAISFQPLRLIDIRNAIRLDVAATAQAREDGVPDPPPGLNRDLFTRTWAIRQFLDRGVHADDAETQVDLAIAQERRLRTGAVVNAARQSLARFIANVREEYRSGILDRLKSENLLRQSGMDDASVRLTLDTIDFEQSRKTVNETIKLVRRRFMDGVIDVNGVRTELERIGIVVLRIGEYQARWNAQRDLRYRIAQTGKIQEWARGGLLSVADATQRLRNLGWDEPDILLHLAEVQANINQIQASAVRAAAQAQRAQARDLERLVQRSQSQTEDIQADLRRASPMSSLKKWIKRGIIGEDFFIRRAIAMGIPEDDALRHLQESLANGEQATQPGPQTGASAQGQIPQP